MNPNSNSAPTMAVPTTTKSGPGVLSPTNKEGGIITSAKRKDVRLHLCRPPMVPLYWRHHDNQLFGWVISLLAHLF